MDTIMYDVLYIIFEKLCEDDISFAIFSLVNKKYNQFTKSFGRDKHNPYKRSDLIDKRIDKKIDCTKMAKHGYFNLLKWARQYNYDMFPIVHKYVIKNNNFEMLKWIYQNNLLFDNNVSIYAARYGRFEILKWMYRQNYEFSIMTFRSAIKNGHLEIVKWLHQKGCQTDMESHAIAIRHNQFDILKWLYYNHCRSENDLQNVRTYENYFLATAIDYNRFDMLKWMYDKALIKIDDMRYMKTNHNFDMLKWLWNCGCNMSCITIESAITHNNLEMFVWIIEHRHNIGSDRECYLTVKQGNLEILKWIYQNNYEICDNILQVAILYGHFEMIKWLFEKHNLNNIDVAPIDYIGNPFNLSVNNIVVDTESLFHVVLISGHFEIIKWLHKNKYVMTGKIFYNRNMSVTDMTFDMLKWLHEHKYPWENYVNAMTILTDFDAIKWIYEHGYEWDKSITEKLISVGHFEILKWIVSKGCKLSDDACIEASRHGYFEILKWIHNDICPITITKTEDYHTKFPSLNSTSIYKIINKNQNDNHLNDYSPSLWGTFVCAEATRNGYFNILKWLHENNCDWDGYVCDAAIGNDCLEILKWAREKGCPWNKYTLYITVSHGRLRILEWILNNGYPFSHDIWTYATNNGHHHIIKWAHAKGYPMGERELHAITQKWPYFFSNRPLGKITKGKSDEYHGRSCIEAFDTDSDAESNII